MIFGWLTIDRFFAVGQWPITHVFGLPEHFVTSPAAANFLPHYLATLIFAIVRRRDRCRAVVPLVKARPRIS
jgi:hypothetical protein